MISAGKLWRSLAIVAGCFVLSPGVASTAQAQQRYTPNTPTVSPYLNLFQNNRGVGGNTAIPNYYSLVRPQVQQQQTNRLQQRTIQQQAQTIGQLQTNVDLLEQQARAGQSSVSTGHRSWFSQPSQRNRYLNTSRFYSQSGTATQIQR
jgi:hypothetical protein